MGLVAAVAVEAGAVESAVAVAAVELDLRSGVPVVVAAPDQAWVAAVGRTWAAEAEAAPA